MPSPVIVDTNVVGAGLLTARDDSPVARTLDGMLAALFPYAISETLLAEYRAVLLRPAMRKAHGLTASEVDILLVQLAQHAIVLRPDAGPTAPERGDQHLWDLIAAREDLVLVTGDKLLLKDRGMASRIITPATFVEQWLR